MKNLNKENFWNEMQEKHPITMKKFCIFIDEFKEKHEWNRMFNPKIKFHDIPIVMQIGVIHNFFIELDLKINSNEFENHEGIKSDIESDFSRYESKLKQLN